MKLTQCIMRRRNEFGGLECPDSPGCVAGSVSYAFSLCLLPTVQHSIHVFSLYLLCVHTDTVTVQCSLEVGLL